MSDIEGRAIPELTEQEVGRFRSTVAAAGDGCWAWTGDVGRNGYGRFYVRRDGRRRSIPAHRLTYKLATGVDPGALLVRHRCDNKPCCNPAHLHTGTKSDNARDAVERGQADLTGLTAYRVARDACARADIAANRRRCGTCNETLPLEDFVLCRRSIGGRTHRCKACGRAAWKAKREAG